MKTILIAAGMSVLLFLYGYLLSTAGHDHSSHENVSVKKEHSISGQEEPNHDHHH